MKKKGITVGVIGLMLIGNSLFTATEVFAAAGVSIESMKTIFGGCPTCCDTYSCKRNPNPDCLAQNGGDGACVPILWPCDGDWQAAPYTLETCRNSQTPGQVCEDGAIEGCGYVKPCYCFLFVDKYVCAETWIGSSWTTQATSCYAGYNCDGSQHQ